MLPLINFNQGVDYIDSMYSPGNFAFFKQMEGTWVVATFLSNAIGYLLNLLPFGGTYLGIRIYTSLVVSAIAITSYIFFEKRIEWYVAFVGEVLAICLCWCPTTILYNYLTYFFMMLGLIWLYIGLTRDENKYLILAGIALGTNLFVRFPNITEVAFIVAVWVYGALKKKKFVKVLQETLWCMLGYFVSVAICMGIIVLLYGADSYVQMITSLFAMTGDNTSYQPVQMVMAMVRELQIGIKWTAIMVIPVVVFTLIGKALKGRFKVLIIALSVIGSVCSIILCIRLGMFDFNYNTYQCFNELAVTFVIICIVISLIAIFNPNVSVDSKLAYGLMLICMAITPLGSNNGLFPIFNNLFLIAPVILAAIWKMVLKSKEKSGYISVAVVVLCFLAVFYIQAIGFRGTFSFRGQTYGEERDYKIENNEILKGCYTDKERAEDIDELNTYWNENATDKVLLLGNIPGVSYFLDAPCAISTSWPDLGSYAYDVYALQMKELEGRIDEKGEELPTIIVNYGVYSVMEEDLAAQDYFLENAGDGEGYLDLMLTDPKVSDLKNFIQKYGYSIQLCNKHFVVYYVG